MKRYIAQFHKGGFPELYHVAERVDGQWVRVGEPKPYHAANDEAEARNNGTFGMGIIYLTPDYSSGSYLLMQRAIPPQPRGGCYAR